eukprot:Hpha_TRINITY_DN14690_c0_g2::TRINITY_DN14690_c0_g2_i3::g.48189::m.48189
MVGGQLSIFFEDCQLDPARLLADTGISNECTVEARLTAAWRWPHVGTTPAESAHFAHRPWLYEVHSGGLGLTKVQEGVYNITAERSPGVAHPGEWKIAVLRAPADAAVVDSVGLLPPRSRSLLGPGGLSVKLKFGTVFNERKLVGELGTPIQAGDALVWRTLADGVLKIELRREGARWSCVEVKGWTRDPEQDMPTVKVRGEWSFLLTNP